MASELARDDDAAEVLIAGLSEVACGLLADLVTAEGLRARICHQATEAHGILNQSHRIELILYLNDLVGRAVRATASDLAARGFEVPAVPAVLGKLGAESEAGGDSADWALVRAALEAAKRGSFRPTSHQSGVLPSLRSGKRVFRRTRCPFGADAERSVLVVEDDLIVARALSRMLVRLGYKPIVVHSVRKARECEPTSFGYALIDHLLPDPEGLELGRWLASLPHGIAVAVYSGAFNIELSLLAQAYGVLAVPRPEPVDLVRVLETLQTRRRASRAVIAGGQGASQRGRTLKRQSGSGLRRVAQSASRPLHVSFCLRGDGLWAENGAGPTVIGLRAAERRILAVLALARGKPVSAQTLGYRALGRTDAGAGQSVRQHISTLRGALGEYHYLVLTTHDGEYRVTQLVDVDASERILAG